jgi:hypothetical protein
VLWDAQQAWDDHPYTTYLEPRGSDGRVVLRRDDRFLPTWQRSAWPANQSMLQRRWLDLDNLNPGTSALTVQVTAGPGSAPLPVRIEPGSHFLPGAARDWAP